MLAGHADAQPRLDNADRARLAAWLAQGLRTASARERWVGSLGASRLQDLAAQVIFGALPAGGRLPVTASAFFRQGMGLDLLRTQRLDFLLPEGGGVGSDAMRRVDSIVLEGIAKGAYPGCQVLVARDGHVLWNRAYGSTMYTGGRPVRTDDLYDLASVTKVAGTTLVRVNPAAAVAHAVRAVGAHP